MSFPVTNFLYAQILLTIFVSGSLASGIAGETVDLMPIADGWKVPQRVSRCPVHREIRAKQEQDGHSVTFAVVDGGHQEFSIMEIPVLTGGLDGFQGLRLNFSTTGNPHWKLRLYDGEKHVRFVHVIDFAIDSPVGQMKARQTQGGTTTLVIPWNAFTGEHLSPGGISTCRASESCHRIHPPTIETIGIMLSHGGGAASVTIHHLHAIVTWKEAPPGVTDSATSEMTTTAGSETTSASRVQNSRPSANAFDDTTASYAFSALPSHLLWMTALCVLRNLAA